MTSPHGSIVVWSDGTHRPPERHRKKLAAWEERNSKGRLIRKQGKRGIGNVGLSPDFTLHEGDFGAKGVITIRIHRTSFSLDTNLTFKVIERPQLGHIRVVDLACENAELVHLAANRQAAEEWLTQHRYPNAVLEEVTADEVAAAHVEGRVAA
ncbi:hypothetical protein ELI24_32375 (plasmid) [Rhizobium ruizarguesonis]|uniref:Uncharacterized protein n=1 Tax=Rhizobium leguminosarum TaxID=384 RepID=A0A7M3DJM9_RHILE|nr:MULTISPECIES: hypothetical protein [Rhizobium]TAU15696.1 hypothetical protein ELI48_32415 [Rhizobium ruizarguesonis]TAU35358.1 hypothetical protein ELI43_36780 [Rhizobium leguminosarum]TAU37555.1 hypothetical protein ELI42_36085 [Rhizobium ruizarguesonis]TAU46352.1 hypothetical protein ELI44_33460 [Rhizobium ruizarguesonis]TAU59100.1 hypothetical protein ELI45_31900 [Rhizobium ruizarguesonis]